MQISLDDQGVSYRIERRIIGVVLNSKTFMVNTRVEEIDYETEFTIEIKDEDREKLTDEEYAYLHKEVKGIAMGDL